MYLENVNLKKFGIVLFILLALSYTFHAALTVQSWTVSADSFKPGGSGIITLELSNPAATTGSTAKVNGVNIEVYANPAISVSGQRSVGDIEAGASTKISLPFKIADNVKSGIYQVDIQISGSSDKSGGGVDSFIRRVSIPITVVNAPILSMTADKTVISGITKVNLTIVNDGGTANNLKITLPLDSKLGFYGAGQVFVSSVSNRGTTTVTLDSRNMNDGPADVTFNLAYEDELGLSHTATAILRLTVRNEQLDISFMQQSEIITKKESTLTLTIKNLGTESLSDLRLLFNGTTIRLKDGNEIKFGDVPVGGSATATATIYAEATPGLNQVDSQITWIERDEQKKENRKIPLTFSSDTDVGVFLEAKPVPLTLGTQHTISVLVSNLGSYKIDNVDVSLSSPVLRSLDISNSQYIGGLQSNDFSTVQFSTIVNATSLGEYPLYVTINYRDYSGEVKQKVIQKSITINPPVAQETGLTTYLCGGAVVVLAGVAIWYFKYRKK